MRIGFYNTYEHLNKDNFMFNNLNTNIGDNLFAPLIDLKEYASQCGVTVGTLENADNIDLFDSIVFFDMPRNPEILKKAVESGKPLYLAVFESKMMIPENFDVSLHKYFRKIFTYYDPIIDNKKYFKINYSVRFPAGKLDDASKRNRFCAMIISNKFVEHHSELYSERINAVRWFDQNHPEKFDLYGGGWNRYCFFNVRVTRKLSKYAFVRRFCKPEYPSNRGSVDSKIKTYKHYKFAICYENIADIPGYISEKILDCLAAGTVPVYRGADNISAHIPENCFIDRRMFKTYEQLFEYLNSLSDKDINCYIRNIENFFNSSASYEFSTEFFSKTFVDQILN